MAWLVVVSLLAAAIAVLVILFVRDPYWDQADV